jgi:hypothetical protein
MILYFMRGKKNRATIAYETFHKSQEAYVAFLRVAEGRALQVSPGHKLAWQNAFRSQHLLKRRQTLRFEYLYANDLFDDMTLRSLSSINERLDIGWTKAEESALKEGQPSYRDISREIEDIQSKWDPHTLDGPRPLLEKDSKYLDARQALAERARKLAVQLQE